MRALQASQAAWGTLGHRAWPARAPDTNRQPNTTLTCTSPPRLRPAMRLTSSPASLPFFCARRLGFFITTPAAEAQLELDLAEQRCPLDASADRDNLYLTLFTFDALDINFHNVTREFRLAEMLQVRRCRPAAPAWGTHVLQRERRDDEASPCMRLGGARHRGFRPAVRAFWTASAPPQDFGGGELSLFFANCEQDSRVTFDVEVALYNVRGGCPAAPSCGSFAAVDSGEQWAGSCTT